MSLDGSGVGKLLERLRSAEAAGEAHAETATELIADLEATEDRARTDLDALETGVEGIAEELSRLVEAAAGALEQLAEAAGAAADGGLPGATSDLAQGVSALETGYGADRDRLAAAAEELREAGFAPLAAAVEAAGGAYEAHEAAAAADFDELAATLAAAEEVVASAEEEAGTRIGAETAHVDPELLGRVKEEAEAAAEAVAGEADAVESAAAAAAPELEAAYAELDAAAATAAAEMLDAVVGHVEQVADALGSATLESLDGPCETLTLSSLPAATGAVEATVTAAGGWPSVAGDGGDAAEELVRADDARRRFLEAGG